VVLEIYNHVHLCEDVQFRVTEKNRRDVMLPLVEFEKGDMRRPWRIEVKYLLFICVREMKAYGSGGWTRCSIHLVREPSYESFCTCPMLCICNTTAQIAVICVFTYVCLIEDSNVGISVVASVCKLADSIEVVNLEGRKASNVFLCLS
jgi:hypothetical protein